MPENLHTLFYLTLTLLKRVKSKINMLLDILCSKVFNNAEKSWLTNVENAIGCHQVPFQDSGTYPIFIEADFRQFWSTMPAPELPSRFNETSILTAAQFYFFRKPVLFNWGWLSPTPDPWAFGKLGDIFVIDGGNVWIALKLINPGWNIKVLFLSW